MSDSSPNDSPNPNTTLSPPSSSSNTNSTPPTNTSPSQPKEIIFTIPGSSATSTTGGHDRDTSAVTRPGTGTSIASDPFGTPWSSRPPSIRYQYGTSSPNGPGTGPGYGTPANNGSTSGTSNGAASTSIPDPFLSGPRKSFIQAQQHAYTSGRSSASRLAPGSASPTMPSFRSNAKPQGLTRMKSHALPELLATPTPSADGGAPEHPTVTIPKPWRDGMEKSFRGTFAYWVVYFLVFLGIAGGAVQCFFQYTKVPLDRRPLCMVMEENFDNEDRAIGENGTFFREVNMDGFGNGEFEMTTASRNNSFVKDGMLYLVPTLTSDNIGMDAVLDGTVYNITGCTFNITHPDNGFIMQGGQRVFDVDGYTKSCSAVSNKTAGTVINPVQSARLTTRYSASIKFGRVEIRAKMPTGDWLWPAMWMLPVNNVYGPWPLSGEIDIVESRGNGIRYTARGSNYVQGSLNWGPALGLNGVQNTFSWWTNRRKSFGSQFHTYALEWTPEFLRIYVDTRLHTLLDLKFNKPFFQRGDFPDTIFNGSSIVPLQNPWINGTNATPFDQDFYLILNLAVGATNGWFPEAQGDKPWLDRAQNPPADFLRGIQQWYPTWPTNVEDRAMIVDYVKMWKHC